MADRAPRLLLQINRANDRKERVVGKNGSRHTLSGSLWRAKRPFVGTVFR